MLASMQKTIRTAGVRGLFDGISGTWLRQMSYSLCRFWAYDESKKIVGAGKSPFRLSPFAFHLLVYAAVNFLLT